jgi:hypothetical protein
MDPDGTRETVGDNEDIEETPPVSDVAGGRIEQLRSVLGSGINRRTFLAAAALGSAAAAMVNRTGSGFAGLSLGPLPAFANDLSGKPCTANDVQIIGSGVVQNEPCTVTGTAFDATVAFVVRNNTGTDRYCVGLHLIRSGPTPCVPQDIVLKRTDGSSTAPQKSDTTMTGVITGFPTNATGLVCFGAPGVTSGKCADCTCTTISWNTQPSAAGCTTPDQTPAGGQCRHQQVCVVGFGASLSCATNCTPTCGGVSTLVACVAANDGSQGGTSQLPITWTLTGTDGTTASGSITALTSFTACITQTVTVTTATTYTVVFTDNSGCSRTATTSLSATPQAAPSITQTGPNCSGVVTLCAASSGATSFTFSDGTTTITSTQCATFTYTPTTTAQTHVVTVVASNGAGCSATSTTTVTVRAAVNVTVSQSNDCTGNVTLTATPTGGNGTFTINWSNSGGTSGSGTTFTIAGPGAGNTATHVVTITACDTGTPSCCVTKTGTFTTTFACATVTTATFT